MGPQPHQTYRPYCPDYGERWRHSPGVAFHWRKCGVALGPANPGRQDHVARRSKSQHGLLDGNTKRGNVRSSIVTCNSWSRSGHAVFSSRFEYLLVQNLNQSCYDLYKFPDSCPLFSFPIPSRHANIKPCAFLENDLTAVLASDSGTLYIVDVSITGHNILQELCHTQS